MKKRLHNSRRGRALLYALLLVVVILVSSTAGFYRILPQQAILERAEEQGIETLEPVMWIRGENPIGTGPARLTLSVGERGFSPPGGAEEARAAFSQLRLSGKTGILAGKLLGEIGPAKETE